MATFGSCTECGSPASVSHSFELMAYGPGDKGEHIIVMEKWVCSASLSHSFTLEAS